MKDKFILLTGTILGGLLVALVWLLVLAQLASPVQADPAVLYVAPDGTCEGASPCFANVQAAVDAANPGDEIRIATGVYTDVHVRSRVVLTTTDVFTQVVYLSKTLTLRGGYTTTNWITPDTANNPTILDAQGQGRVIYVAGNITATLEGLRFTQGAGNTLTTIGSGGGLLSIAATVILSDCQIDHNVATSGGGLSFSSSQATLIANTIHDNTAGYSGGGLIIESSSATLRANTIFSNTSSYGDGGGLYLARTTDAVLIGNLIQGNASNGTDYKFTHGGGGAYLAGNVTLSGNTIQSNTARLSGGGLYLSGNAATLNGNLIVGNAAVFGSGAGLYTAIDTSTLSSNLITGNLGDGIDLIRSQATLINNVIADNQANGIYIAGGAPQLLFNTVARNGSSSGIGVFVSTYIANGGYSYSSTASLTNTILVSHSVGLSLTTGNTATINGILWYATPITLSQANSTTAIIQNQVEGDPAFDVDGYHLTAASLAIGAGVPTGPWSDIDNEPRRNPPDLGADEYWAPGALQKIYLPLVLR